MASKITYDNCTCCGSAAISKVFTCVDHTVSKKAFDIWKCTSCTFRFTQHAPDLEHIAPYYQSAAYVSHSDTKEGFINQLYHRVRNFTLKSKRNLVKKVSGVKHGVLLDVGAGTGAFAHTMKQAGWSVTALEPDNAARANALANYDLTLDSLQSLNELQPAAYDAITLWHVLEHVHDLHGYLHTFERLLKTTGRLIIAVPNYTSHDASVYKEHWAAYDVPRHLYHFSPRSMHTLLEQRNLVIEKMKPMWFDSFYVSMLSEQYMHGRSRNIRAFFNGLVSNWKALFNVSKCSSVIYIIRKK